MTEPLLYARAQSATEAGVPKDWHNVEVIDAESGERILNVIEADARGGWFVRFQTEPDGRRSIDRAAGQVRTERVDRPIRLRRKGEA